MTPYELKEIKKRWQTSKQITAFAVNALIREVEVMHLEKAAAQFGKKDKSFLDILDETLKNVKKGRQS